MPFLWDTVATRGQLFGNADVGSAVGVSNAARISYPGYHEMLTGFTRASITDNRDNALKRDIASGRALGWDDVEIDASSEAVRVRREMERVCAQ